MAIVGGGFSGVALATELLRSGDDRRVTLLESGPRLAEASRTARPIPRTC
ncbi:MAG TPA: FAD-dependent oxidoreductase [Gammaproteobacteria bacterium]